MFLVDLCTAWVLYAVCDMYFAFFYQHIKKNAELTRTIAELTGKIAELTRDNAKLQGDMKSLNEAHSVFGMMRVLFYFCMVVLQ